MEAIRASFRKSTVELSEVMKFTKWSQHVCEQFEPRQLQGASFLEIEDI